MSSKIPFEIKGFSKEYYVGNKLKGCITLQKPDRKNFGSEGRKKEILVSDLIFTNKKKIKKGTEVVTELIPICGRLKKEK